MFGRKKMYKQGMADAMSANQDFMAKQQAAIERMREDVRNGDKRLEDALNGAIQSLDGCVIGLSNYLNAREKEVLYKLSAPMDIKELDKEEKQLLVAVLYQLANNEGTSLSMYQRNFIRSVQKYVGISNPQIQADLSVVGDIDSLEVQKAFLRVVLEFFYLKNGNELNDAQEEFLSYFSVNKKQAELIEGQVAQLYAIVGEAGIAEKYGFDPTQFEDAHKVSTGPDRQTVESCWADVQAVFDENFSCIRLLSPLVLDTPDIESFEDDFPTKQSAKEAGERELRKLYDYVVSAVSPYSKNSLAVVAADDVSKQVDHLLEKVKKEVRAFGQKTGCRQEAQKMEELLDISTFSSSIKPLFVKELDQNSYKYSFDSFYHYASKIEYDSDDCEIETGFFRLLEKLSAKWDYSLLDAEMELEDSFYDHQKSFASAATDIVKRELRDNIFSKMYQIQARIGTTSTH